MKVLMLVNWNVKKATTELSDSQPSNYYIPGEKYWFFRHIKDEIQVDVKGVSNSFISKIERKIFKFYIFQTIKILFRLKKYDVVISHGAQSGVFLSFLRRFKKWNFKHILIDVGAFNSASEKNRIQDRMLKFASKSLDYVIYHESNQIKYYEKYYPWLVGISRFIPYGADIDFFTQKQTRQNTKNDYVICVGYSKRDWNTLIKAYRKVKTDCKLLLLGKKIYTDDNRIVSLEKVDVNSMIQYILGARFCVLPLENYNYSFGQMTFLQQCLLKKLVIVSKVSSMIDYGIDHKTCMFFEAGDHEELSKIICEMLADEEKCKLIGENAHKFVCDILSDKNMALNIYSVLKELVENEKK